MSKHDNLPQVSHRIHFQCSKYTPCSQFFLCALPIALDLLSFPVSSFISSLFNYCLVCMCVCLLKPSCTCVVC